MVLNDLKKFKTVIGDYGFLTGSPTWHRCTRLDIIFKMGLLYGFFFKCCILGQNSCFAISSVSTTRSWCASSFTSLTEGIKNCGDNIFSLWVWSGL